MCHCGLVGLYFLYSNFRELRKWEVGRLFFQLPLSESGFHARFIFRLRFSAGSAGFHTIIGGNHVGAEIILRERRGIILRERGDVGTERRRLEHRFGRRAAAILRPLYRTDHARAAGAVEPPFPSYCWGNVVGAKKRRKVEETASFVPYFIPVLFNALYIFLRYSLLLHKSTNSE